MMNTRASYVKYGRQSLSNPIPLWRLLQVLVWMAGAFIFFCLFFYPALGITLFWNILIPVAPALLVVAPGVWRNICPLATTVLLPCHLGKSKKKIITDTQLGKLNLIGTLALFIIVPLRHPILNNNGMATAMLLLGMAIAGILLGFFYEWKSAWCSGLCPVHPVEKLYGGNVSITVPNAHCRYCMKCVIPCPDSTPNISPRSSRKTIYHRLSGMLITGGLPGFIWGWFMVRDTATTGSLHSAINAYTLPMTGLLVSMCMYMIISGIIGSKHGRVLINIFAAMSVSCYYWFRIPALLGFGYTGNDGLLTDLSHTIPYWIIIFSTSLLTATFFFLLVFRKSNKRSWLTRPAYHHRNAGASHSDVSRAD